MHYFTLNSKSDIHDTNILFRKLFITYNFKLSAHLTKLAKHYKLGECVGEARKYKLCYLRCPFKKQTFILLSGIIQ